MYLSPPVGRLPRCVCVNAVGAISNDPVFGPAVMFGLGGVLVESIRDVTFRLAPFSPGEALRMIGEIRGRAALERPRGQRPRDLAALARTLNAPVNYPSLEAPNDQLKIAEVKTEIQATKAEILKWVFGAFAAQTFVILGAIFGAVFEVVHTLAPH